MIGMMDQRINSAVYIEVLSEPMNFPLNVSHRKEMRDHTRYRKNLSDPGGNRTHGLRI